MEIFMKFWGACLSVLILISCATVRQEDLNAWKGVPVSALDTHSIFLTMPMVKTFSENGTEIRNYINGKTIANCHATGGGSNQATGYAAGSYVNVMSMSNFNAFQSCASRFVACNNIFYIRKGKVIEYKPSGQCFTDARAQPEPGWENR